MAEPRSCAWCRSPFEGWVADGVGGRAIFFKAISDTFYFLEILATKARPFGWKIQTVRYRQSRYVRVSAGKLGFLLAVAPNPHSAVDRYLFFSSPGRNPSPQIHLPNHPPAMAHAHPLTYSLAFRAIVNGPILLSLDFSFDGRRIARSQTASADAKAMAHAQKIWTYLEYPSNPVVADAAIDALGQETIDALDELIAELADHHGLTARLDRLICPKLGLLPCKLIEFRRAIGGAAPEGWHVRGAEELLAL